LSGNDCKCKEKHTKKRKKPVSEGADICQVASKRKENRNIPRFHCRLQGFLPYTI
jgi:hypothetical protein